MTKEDGWEQARKSRYGMILRELKKIRKAMFNVSLLWDEEDEVLNAIMNEDFPFNQSFDDLAFEVSTWVESVETKMGGADE